MMGTAEGIKLQVVEIIFFEITTHQHEHILQEFTQFISTLYSHHYSYLFCWAISPGFQASGSSGSVMSYL